ncbi:DUF5004 domain-containing protein [Gillisia sp. M10.2A]|uniref:DUF5004 domain-containing protein n=1 Tax=Gillisia lutea TaxID=2909668 RepID=A0ABS9EE93_9FLAO|nr:lipocalin family protein [Gillisia lutea]MCF4100214.1 DUF5004 domain-containing protein [Gillisia lutea]
MNKFLKFCFLSISLSLTLFSCSSEDTDDARMETFNTNNIEANITPMELYGTWKLSVMQSDVLVDLNKDNTGSYNLLSETSCFSNMAIVFREDMTFTTTNAKLDFNGGTNNNEFTCVEGRQDSGTWDVEDNVLILNINIDGMVYSQRKPLSYTNTTFSFDITEAESNAYVDDPGNTSASNINILSVEYTKQ